MPFTFASQPFRGGNSLVTSGAWFMAGLTAGSSNHDICARHAFSLNNCNGCHKRESGTDGTGGSTNFTHITTSPGVPVQLSKFLTGGGPGLVFNVNDPQLGAAVVWQFADLERRFQRLFDIANCTACATVRSGTPGPVNQILQLAKVLPIDPTSDVRVARADRADHQPRRGEIDHDPPAAEPGRSRRSGRRLPAPGADV
ncbi:MAG TPA: hypothetical protein VGC42_02755 [Kofleriaceae bacterium]